MMNKQSELMFMWRLLWALEKVKPGFWAAYYGRRRCGEWHWAYHLVGERIKGLVEGLCEEEAVEVWKYEN